MIRASLAKSFYLSVAGIMGSGKTTAVRILANAFGLHTIEESVSHNIFLPRFYEEPKQWALHTQLFYLTERVRQLRTLPRLLDRGGVAEDSPIEQNRFCYAKAQHRLGNMTDEEYELYERTFDTTTEHLRKPDLLIFLDAPLSVITEHIKERGRDYEQKIPLSYVEALDSLERTWISSYLDAPVLSVPAGELDFVSNPGHRKRFISMVEDALS